MKTDAFAPIEAASPAGSFADAPEAFTAMVPVPNDAPALDVVLSIDGQRRGPDQSWAYRDGCGRLIGYAVRWNTPGGKDFRFALYGANGASSARWTLRHHPVPRPLYGLDKLAKWPEAAVVVVEGEKAAEAAQTVFRDAVAVTSPGGANAARKADWAPLKCRRVVIWPGHDKAGQAYLLEVCALLTGIAREVMLIDPQALAAALGAGPVIQGWDVADALRDHAPEAILRAAEEVWRVPAPAPAYVSWGDFTMTAEDGLKGRKGEKRTWISAPFEIIGRTRDPDGNSWGRYIRWRDHDGRRKERFVADAALHGEPAVLCAGLADAGLSINRAEQRTFVTYLAGSKPEGRVTLVQLTGWHRIAEQDVFVLPEGGIGPESAGTVILDAAARGPYEMRGTLKDWRDGVAALAGGHALPVLAVSTALAGPLLHLAGLEGGGLNLSGQSSRGKTTCLQVAASVWGRGGTPGYLRSWRATANGLEGAAASATDTVLILDELGQVDAREAAAAFYSLSNGAGKARAARDGALQNPKTWRVLILSSGEIPAEAKLGEDRGRKARAGQLVRMLDVPADRGLGFGAFDHGGPEGDSGLVSKSLNEAATSAYGTAGPEFVRRLIAESVSGEVVRRLIDAFARAHLPAGADGQVTRAAERFGLIAAAGEMAIQFGVVPWKEGEARKAAQWAFGEWLKARGGTEPMEVRQAIEQVRLFIEQHGESRFEDYRSDALQDSEDRARPVINRAGWRKGSGANRQWFVLPVVWKTEICAGLDSGFVARVLADKGMAERISDGFQPVRFIEGQNKRVHVINATIFDGAAHAS